MLYLAEYREVLKRSIESIPCNVKELREDNKTHTLTKTTQLSTFGLQKYVILHF